MFNVILYYYIRKCVFVKLKENHIILTDQIYKDTPIGQNTDSRHCVHINSTRLMEVLMILLIQVTHQFSIHLLIEQML
jgi:hypothetical protein